ncbi:hypothetical protein EST38_g14242 [Candolleomyces aberdarensis]|uniref:Protein kinase domain-containing protein n=1 Tax=Candolleomyces aberdarensis TaxID=2316362 RepID=A0A4Q2CXW9_9AGAR|nr:hypothetical protein EST38_g14242 [Candolleomyces aberdarensis]
MSTEQENPVAEDYELRPEQLTPEEIPWRDRYSWLLSVGYRLRERYNPDWKPSWVGTKKEALACEDAQPIFFASINHAVRSETGDSVVLKHIDHAKFPREIEVMKFLSEEPLASDPRNHSVRPIEILQPPNEENASIVVIPLLRYYDDPPFDTIGEALDFILQFLTVRLASAFSSQRGADCRKAMHFLHEHRVIHGDVSINNIMMDASGLYPTGFHPTRPDKKTDYSGYSSPKYSRTEKPPKYYMIDFGLAKKFNEGDPILPTARPGTDRSVPEYYDKTKPINPFFVDVYCVGNMIKTEFLDGEPDDEAEQGYYNFEFLRPLITAMTDEDPEKRPTMEGVLAQFNDIVNGMSSSTLRSECVKKGERIPGIYLRHSIEQWFKRLSYIVRRLPPIPSRK